MEYIVVIIFDGVGYAGPFCKSDAERQTLAWQRRNCKAKMFHQSVSPAAIAAWVIKSAPAIKSLRRAS